MMSWSASSRNDGTAMTTNIRAGATVQANSSTPLCVRREGTGLAVSLKRYTI